MTNPYSCFVTTNNEGATAELLADLVQRQVLTLSEIDPCCRDDVAEIITYQLVHKRLFESVNRLPPSGRRWLSVEGFRVVDVNDMHTQKFLKDEGWVWSSVYKHPNGYLYAAYSFTQKKQTSLAI